MDVKKKFICGFFCLVSVFCLAMTTAWPAEKNEKQAKAKTKEDPINTSSISKGAGFKLPNLPPRVPPLVPKYPDPSIVEVQKQLADIVQIQQTLQFQQYQQISEIQKIVEQAQAHQKLLGELEKTRGSLARESEVDAAIRRQKIQLIEEQAAKNQAALEEMKEKKDAKEKSTEKKLTAISDKAPSEQKPKKSGWWWNFEK